MLRWRDVQLEWVTVNIGLLYISLTVLLPSACTSSASYSAVRYRVFECITLSFKVSFHNLWPPTIQHRLGGCPNMLRIPQPTVNKHREMNSVLQCFHFICLTLLCGAPLSKSLLTHSTCLKDLHTLAWHAKVVWNSKLCVFSWDVFKLSLRK